MDIDDDELSRVRPVRDFLWLLWDMTVRWYTWDWKTAKAAFGFHWEAAIMKAKRALSYSVHY